MGADLDTKRIEGIKAMERFDHFKNKEEVRTPTSSWAGFALSKSSPFALESNASEMSHWAKAREKLLFDKVATTSLLDCMPSNDRIALSQFKDIHSLLTHIKLEHYISELLLEVLKLKL